MCSDYRNIAAIVPYYGILQRRRALRIYRPAEKVLFSSEGIVIVCLDLKSERHANFISKSSLGLNIYINWESCIGNFGDSYKFSQAASRDLKPENLLFDHNRNIKIADFGLSNLYSAGETLKTACGSPCYAAPEMIEGKWYHGIKVDIWSSGIILYASICGFLPFEDPNTAALYKKITRGEFSIPKFVSSGARDMLKCVLKTDPEKRYTIEMIRNHPWFQISQPEQIPEGIIMNKDVIPVKGQFCEQKVYFTRDR
mgnify:CR=1 FL=1